MADEIQVQDVTGLTLYAQVRKSLDPTKILSTVASAFVTFSSADWLNYDIAMTEQGSSGLYLGTIPSYAGSGVFSVTSYAQSGVSPAESDLAIATGNITYNAAGTDLIISDKDELALLVPSTSGMDDDLFALLSAGAQKIAENYCHRLFRLAYSATEYYDWPRPGQRPEVILKRRPVVSISLLACDPTGGGGQITGTFGSATELVAGEDYYFEADRGTIQFLRTRSSWPITLWGFGGSEIPNPYPYAVNARHGAGLAIKVTYTAGFDAYPDDLKLAIAQLIGWLAGDSSGGSGAMESGGREVRSYIDVSFGTEQLKYSDLPVLGSTRSILNNYKEAVFSRSRF